MKIKRFITLLLCAAVCLAAVGCGSGKTQQTASDMPDPIPTELSGCCVTGTDGMLVVCGEGDEQRVYVIIGDTSDDKIAKKIKDGDRVELSADVYDTYFPMNAIITGGEIIDGDNAVYMNQGMYDALTGLCFLDTDKAGENGIIVIE